MPFYKNTILFWSGFESNSAVSGVEWDSQVGSASTVSSPVYAGTYAGRLVDGVGSGTRWEKTITSGDVNGPWYIEARIRVATIGTLYGGGNRILSVNPGSGTPAMQLILNSDGSLALKDSTNQIGSNSSALSLDTWYKVGITFFNNTASAKLELSAYLDDTLFAETTTSTFTGATRYLRLGEMSGTAGTATDIYYDNVLVVAGRGPMKDPITINNLRPAVFTPGMGR